MAAANNGDPIASLNTIEQGRRALARREEDLAWASFIMQHQRSYTDAKHAEKRRLRIEEARIAADLRRAQLELEKTQQKDRVLDNEVEKIEKREKTIQSDAARHASIVQARRQRERERAAHESRESMLASMARQRELHIAALKESEAAIRKATNEAYHLRKSAAKSSDAAKQQQTSPSATSAPDATRRSRPSERTSNHDKSSSSVSATRSSRSPSPVRTIKPEWEVQRELKRAAAIERDRNEQARLANIKVLEERQQQERDRQLALERELEAKAAQRAKEVEAQLERDRRAHIELVLRHSQRLSRSAGSVSPRGGDPAENERHNFALDETARQRRERQVVEERAARLSHQAVIAEQTARNIERERELREERIRQAQIAFDAATEAAATAREAETEADRRHVHVLKLAEKEAARHLKELQDERKKSVMLHAMTQRLERTKLLEQIQEDSHASALAARAEQERQAAARTEAQQLLQLKLHQDRVRDEMLRQALDEQRRQAREQVQSAQREARVQREEQRKVHVVDVQRYRQVMQQAKQQVQQRNAAFYASTPEPRRSNHDRSATDSPATSSRRSASKGSYHAATTGPSAMAAVLPPHPEIAHIKERNDAVEAEILRQIDLADQRFASLTRRRL